MPSTPAAGRPTERELFVRAIPPHVAAVEQIPLSSAFPPLRIGRDEVLRELREIEPSVDTTQPHRIEIARPGLHVTVTFPLADPLTEVMVRVHPDSDRSTADQFMTRLLRAADARAFDTGSATLIFAADSDATS